MSKRKHIYKKSLKPKHYKQINLRFGDSGSITLTKLNDQASHTQVVGNVIHMGFPKVSMKLYPHQTCRLNTGWNLTSLPPDTYMSVLPKDEVQAAGLLAIPKTIHAQ